MERWKEIVNNERMKGKEEILGWEKQAQRLNENKGEVEKNPSK